MTVLAVGEFRGLPAAVVVTDAADLFASTSELEAAILELVRTEAPVALAGWAAGPADLSDPAIALATVNSVVGFDVIESAVGGVEGDSPDVIH